MQTHYLAAAVYGAALLATLALASILTPAAWWRRPNLRALAVLAGGTYAIGALLLAFGPLPKPGLATPMAAMAAGATQHLQGLDPNRHHGGATATLAIRTATDQRFVTRHAINLRHAAGTDTRRIAVVPAGAQVRATGLRQGDWWQVRASVGSGQQEGWASSLWLRRLDEAPTP